MVLWFEVELGERGEGWVGEEVRGGVEVSCLTREKTVGGAMRMKSLVDARKGREKLRQEASGRGPSVLQKKERRC